jgi:hypothetical protein
VIYVARHRRRGGKKLIWTAVPIASGPETRVASRSKRTSTSDCRTIAIYEYHRSHHEHRIDVGVT